MVLSPLDHFLNLWMISYENVSLDEPFKPEKDSFITQNLTETRGQKRLILIQDYSVVLV